mmetsp:Transcript_16233/g.49120  ORF Transcript_16233/g.49120 Transcript_16233/m.49120 type:complete len:236 (-) Transcript_16233:1046-1753(-)
MARLQSMAGKGVAGVKKAGAEGGGVTWWEAAATPSGGAAEGGGHGGGGGVGGHDALAVGDAAEAAETDVLEAGGVGGGLGGGEAGVVVLGALLVGGALVGRALLAGAVSTVGGGAGAHAGAVAGVAGVPIRELGLAAAAGGRELVVSPRIRVERAEGRQAGQVAVEGGPGLGLRERGRRGGAEGGGGLLEDVDRRRQRVRLSQLAERRALHGRLRCDDVLLLLLLWLGRRERRVS